MSFEEKYLCDKCKRNGKYNPGTGRSFCDTCYCGSHFDDTVTTTEVSNMLKKLSYNTISDVNNHHDGYRTMTYSIGEDFKPEPKFDIISMVIEKVVFNDPATIVFWTDGTKTVVKAVDEPFDKEKGLAMAICKKLYSNKGKYFNYIKKWTEKED